MTYADQMARFRVAVDTGRLPSDLGRWVLEELARVPERARRFARRDRILREAASLVGGSKRSRAERLEAEFSNLDREPVTELERLVRQAWIANGQRPIGLRQLMRIL